VGRREKEQKEGSKDEGKDWNIYSRRMRQKGTGQMKNGGRIYPRERKRDGARCSSFGWRKKGTTV